ncbi:putative plastidic glucose transporter 2 [Hordeum vulgare]|uniref:probable plastidic glucose transporter 3 isoform X1 n=1 Tax=Hordeum vulgare subsp. vulgare TaxID=112509 RepID=UPI001D1A4DFB|nr:probable plastidic glucose transporter 3 isoform X1 [Hordeum vulgare subsp. vulgare]XP_044965269.1 probable plastidic glucose transporter 3 isoform X1 [Hordeum vulgare subsp. vulgare]XP_044965276.1 probable plastidic glucose transporter 3 isoform X1 [Hordeum vulgare subsp. vulgare]XP_044965283.1 probable plastidic glucose transporter 3 isoform X1 [Hordeum vulgare subsp. vulgare]XP_044965291.1 probable plastidic glucose transporter 3 isoform X1 [Hordeum vulgare subsp. vulgare]XP_044965298.1 
MRWKLSTSAYKRVPSRDAAMDPDLKTPAARTPDGGAGAAAGPSWRRLLPHVCVATVTSFLFGYHTGVVNEPLDSISADIGFAGNTLAEGLVVSICLGGAFVGCLFSGSVADGIGRRRAFQLSALPMIMGAALSCPWFDSSQERICAKGQLFLLTRITATGCSTTTTSTTALTKLSAADTEEQACLL